jgi:hypothetical protein
MLVRLAVGIAAIMLSTASAQAQCPNLDTRPISGRIDLREFFQPDPHRRRVTAGGRLDLSRCRPNWKGWVSGAMDLQLFYRTSGRQSLTFTIESDADTVLLINDPTDTWHFDDDSGPGLNGRIRFVRARDGRYDIWVGMFSSGRSEDARVLISEE